MQSRAIATETSEAELRERRRPVPHRVRPRGLRGMLIADGRTHHSADQRDSIYRRLLGAADIIAAALSLTTAIVILGDDQLRPATFLALPVAVVVSKIIGLYDRDELLLRKTTLEEAPALFELATLYAVLVWLFEGVFIDGNLGRAQFVGLWFSLFGFTLLGRALARAVATRIVSVEPCVLIGDAVAVDRMRTKLGASHVKAALIGRVRFDEDQANGHDGDLLGELHELEAIVAQHDIQRVIVAPRGGSDSDELLDAIGRAKAVGVKVSVLPRIFEVVGSQVEFDDLGGVTVLGVRRFGLTSSSRWVKRGFDLVGGVLAVILFAPVLVVTAIAIKLDSRGPVLFRQTRVGRDGEIFEMVKFRTMVVGAEAQRSALESLNEAHGLFKIADDPRVTRVGGLLRRLSIDELPQLANVLRGDMSLVGPRPLVLEEDRRVEGWHRRRLHLTPGMTGHWQILGSARIPLHEMIKIDYLYVANWSLWTDVKILLRTVPYVLGQRGM